jgi:VanZ family protein
VNPSHPVLTRRHYGWLALGFLTLAVYGSLVPLHFRPLPPGEALTRFRAVLNEPVRLESRSDWVANILLFVPLGFLVMATLAADRGRGAGWAAALVVPPACTALSAALEFTQLYFPPRVSQLNDIVAESVGGLVGTALWLAAGQSLTLRWRRLWADLGGRESAQTLLWVYLGFLVVVHAVPLDLTISPAELYHKYREGRVRLVPFADWHDHPLSGVGKCLTNMALFLPAGLLLPGLAKPFWRQRRNWLPILGLAVGFASLIELMQLCVWTRFFESTDIITGSLAVLCGWAAGVARDAQFGRRPVGLALVSVYLAVLVFISWQPFNFEASVTSAASRLADLRWAPFADYQEADYAQAADQICSKGALFISLGVVTSLCQFGRFHRHGGLAAIFGGLVVGTLLEAGKLALPGRYASVSNVVLAALGVGIGFTLARRANWRTGDRSRDGMARAANTPHSPASGALLLEIGICGRRL